MRLTTPLLVYQLLSSSCGAHPPAVVDADERARPHLAQFERFERWVARTADGSAALPDGAALRETMFAPVRGTGGVLGAWVHLPGRPALDLALLDDSAPPSLLGAQRLRAAGDSASLWRAPVRSELFVVVQRPCVLALPPAKRAVEQTAECVLLAREARTAAGTLRVMAAFADEPVARSSPVSGANLARERSEPRGWVGAQRLCRWGGKGACPSRL